MKCRSICLAIFFSSSARYASRLRRFAHSALRLGIAGCAPRPWRLAFRLYAEGALRQCADYAGNFCKRAGFGKLPRFVGALRIRLGGPDVDTHRRTSKAFLRQRFSFPHKGERAVFIKCEEYRVCCIFKIQGDIILCFRQIPRKQRQITQCKPLTHQAGLSSGKRLPRVSNVGWRRRPCRLHPV